MRSALHSDRQKYNKDGQWNASHDCNSYQRGFRLHGVSPQFLRSAMMLGELKGILAAAQSKEVSKTSFFERAITHGLWRRRRIVGDGHAI
jgi:hypothetical protein